MNIRQNIPAGITRQQQPLLIQAYDFAETLNCWVAHKLRTRIVAKTLHLYFESDDWCCFASYGPKGGVKYAWVSGIWFSSPTSKLQAKKYMRDLSFLRDQTRQLEKQLREGATS